MAGRDHIEAIGPDRQRAYHVLRAVLHALHDRLTVEETAHLSAQLPLLVRGIYFEGWRPSEVPHRERTRGEFLNAVGERLRVTRPTGPDEAVQAVLATLSRHITGGEIAQVKTMLPKTPASLWP